MIRLLYPDQRQLAETSTASRKTNSETLVGFLYPDEILSVFHVVNLKKKKEKKPQSKAEHRFEEFIERTSHFFEEAR
jgi:hypothetical protein